MADVFANNRSILHKGDNNQHVSGPPDVCKTPSPGGPVPLPYPNVAMDSDLAKGTKKVKINGNPVATEAANVSTSTGDEPGTAGGGIASNKTKGKLTWGSASSDVKAEGNGVCRFVDVTQHNGNVWNTVLTALGATTTPGYGDDPLDLPNCSICTRPKGDHRVEADEAIILRAQTLANNLRDPGRPFARVFRNPSNTGPLKKGVMIGVLECQSKESRGYAGLAGSRYDSGTYAAAAAEFRTEAIALTLTPVVDPPTPPPMSGQFPPTPPPPGFNRMSQAQWSAALDRVNALGANYRGNAPLTCAAPKMTQKCLDEGHKPGKMVEIWVGFRDDSTVTIPRFQQVHFNLDPRSRISPQVTVRWWENVAFGHGDPVPSCTTCQVVQTIQCCKLGEPPCP